MDMTMDEAVERAREGNFFYFTEHLSDEQLSLLATKKDADGRSLLHTAVASGNLDLVKFLVPKSTPTAINASDEGGWTPLMSAVSCGHESIAKLLIIDLGADVTKSTHGLRTAAHYAASKGRASILELLIQYSKEIVTMKDSTGALPLHRAAGAGHVNALNVLLHHTPKHMINARDKSGTTPLLAAVLSGHSEAALVLARTGAEIEVEDDEGQTPMSVLNSRRGVGDSDVLREKLMSMQTSKMDE